MYEIIKNVINSGNYELNDMLKKIDTIWIQGDITEERRTELIELARENANVENSIEIIKKLEDHEKRIRTLETGGSTPSPDEYPEYVEGKWYYKDDKITFNGKKYICIAPEGQVCTWSPEGYPTYWQLVA